MQVVRDVTRRSRVTLSSVPSGVARIVRPPEPQGVSTIPVRGGVIKVFLWFAVEFSGDEPGTSVVPGGGVPDGLHGTGF